MERIVNQTPIIVFKGDATEKDLAMIPNDFEGCVVICGNLCVYDCSKISVNVWVMGNICEEISFGNINFMKDLICEGAIINKGGIFSIVTTKIEGDFICNGDICLGSLKVSGDIICNGYINVWEIDVAGDVESIGKITAKHADILGKITSKEIWK